MGTKLTQERLKELLHYDPETGVFTWKQKVSCKVVVGARAGQQAPGKYRYIGLLGSRYLEHRLAILYSTGAWPDDEVDHRNGDKSDNRACNLRPCSHAENHQNRLSPDGSKAPMLGVTWHKLRKRWRACIALAGKQTHLGLFDTPEEAHLAYLTAKASHHTFQPTPRST